MVNPKKTIPNWRGIDPIFIDIYSLGATKIPIPMWRTTASSIKRANDYDYFDDATGIQYDLENPFNVIVLSNISGNAATGCAVWLPNVRRE